MRQRVAPRVRIAAEKDAVLLAELAERTFREAFADDTSDDDMVLHCARSYGADIQSRELADPRYTYLIAEVEGRAAGFALVRAGPAPACVTGPSPVEIQRFYVDAPFQGTGVAQALMDSCDDEAHRRGAMTVWLGVFERNAKARRFYEKCGFRDVGEQTFLVGTDPQRDRVYARAL